MPKKGVRPLKRVMFVSLGIRRAAVHVRAYGV
jgi:hypothetical protein